MSTGLAPPPLDTAQAPSLPPFGIPIEVVGGTGPHASGKTIFGLSIAPGAHPQGHPFAGEPRTLVFDLEKSATTFVAGSGARHRDVPSEIRTEFGPKPYGSIDLFLWFQREIAKIQPWRYDVVMADPITDLEDGLVDWVRQNPAKFGYSADQFRAASGLMWGCVKSAWKAMLVDLAARCHVFYFVAHMRMEFKDGKPTKKMLPKGKDTLDELASLYLQFSRDRAHEGEKPQPPSAVLLKERLSVTSINPKTGELEIVSILPPRLPEATPAAIRYYIQHPVGKRKLKPEEIVQQEHLSEEERRLLELEIEQAKATSAQAELERFRLAQQAALQAAIVLPPAGAGDLPGAGAVASTQLVPPGTTAFAVTGPAPETPCPPPSAPLPVAATSPQADSPASAPSRSTPEGPPPGLGAGASATPAPQVLGDPLPAALKAEIVELARQTYPNAEIFRDVILSMFAAHALDQLSEVQGLALKSRVQRDLAAEKLKRSEAAPATAPAQAPVTSIQAPPDSVSAPSPAPTDPAALFQPPQPPLEELLNADATPGQTSETPINEAQLRRLRPMLETAGWTTEQMQQFLKELGYASFRSLTFGQYRTLVTELAAEGQSAAK